MENEITAEEIAQHYKGITASVDLINAIIDGSEMVDETQEEKNDCVDRNVRHIQIMLAKDYWTNEDMTDANSAITAGQNYLAE